MLITSEYGAMLLTKERTREGLRAARQMRLVGEIERARGEREARGRVHGGVIAILVSILTSCLTA
jgi:hypothetical protein